MKDPEFIKLYNMARLAAVNHDHAALDQWLDLLVTFTDEAQWLAVVRLLNPAGPLIPPPRLDVCRTCTATIYWSHTAAGRPCPFDALTGESHFTTCRQASSWSGHQRSLLGGPHGSER